LRRVGLSRWPDQKMKMLGHQNITNDLESELASQLTQSAYPLVLEPLRVK
jgi:hypothetical protein